MKPWLTVAFGVAVTLGCFLPAKLVAAESAAKGDHEFRQIAPETFPELFLYQDTCNVYVVRDGDAALLVDFGDGSVMEHLGAIGVKKVEWILLTHHHREQCSGLTSIERGEMKVAAPEAERTLLEQPTTFRKMKPSLGDAFTVHGASYVRPPAKPIPLDRTFAKTDQFTWRGYHFRCIETRGNSPGGMSYLVERGGRWFAFSGDVMLDGAKMHTWFDTEWDYGFGAGVLAIHQSASLLESFVPAWLLPSHGVPIREPQEQLRVYQDKLRRMYGLLLRGYEVNTFAPSDQDRVSKPSRVPGLWQVSPHLLKFKGPDSWPNFAILLSESGHGLVVDCGLLDEKTLGKALEGLRSEYGLTKIDAMVITHMHGDHVLNAPYLRQMWGAQIWTLDRIAKKCETPEQFDYAAMIEAYGVALDRLKIDRQFTSGEVLDWEGYKLTVDWMPGQTEFSLCMHGEIDRRKVAFTGDHLFGNPADPTQSGHEALVARNSAILEEGYMLTAKGLKQIKPDIIVGGHSYVIGNPSGMIDRLGVWTVQMRDALAALSSQEDYRTWFDPYWVRADSYRTELHRGESAEIAIHVRNFHSQPRRHRIAITAPPGLSVEPAVIEGELAAAGSAVYRMKATAAGDAPPGVGIGVFDVTLDGEHLGPWMDFIVNVLP